MSTHEGLDADPALAGRPAVTDTWNYLREHHGDGPLSLRSELDLDSMAWIELATRIGERTGVRVDDQDIARVETVRDLLVEVARRADAGDGTPVAPLTNPEDLLGPVQRRHLDPLPASRTPAARAMFALDRALFRTVFGLRVSGLHHLPASGPFVIAPNHISYLDGLVVAATLPYERLSQQRWITYAGQALRNGVTRLVSRLALMVPIDGEQAPLASLAAGAAVLNRGHVLVWFPSGERSPDGHVLDFAPGIGVLLQHYPVPVVPVVIDGTFQAMPLGRTVPRPHKVAVTFGPAQQPHELARSGAGDDEATRITTGLRSRIVAMRDDPANRT